MAGSVVAVAPRSMLVLRHVSEKDAAARGERLAEQLPGCRILRIVFNGGTKTVCRLSGMTRFQPLVTQRVTEQRAITRPAEHFFQIGDDLSCHLVSPPQDTPL